MSNPESIIKVRVYDGIVGLLNISSILLASQFILNWNYVAVAVAFFANHKSPYKDLSSLHYFKHADARYNFNAKREINQFNSQININTNEKI